MSLTQLSRFWFRCLLATWLLAAGAGAGAVAEEPAPPPPEGHPAVVEARVEGGLLTLQADGVPLAEVLRAIGVAGSFGVVLHGAFDAPVRRSFSGEPVDDAIRDLVAPHSLVVIRNDEAGLAEIRVTANRESDALASADAEPNRSEMAPEEGPTDPMVEQEAYRQKVMAYVPPTKAEVLFELGDPNQVSRMAAIPKVGSLRSREAIAVLSHVFTQDEDRLVRSRAVAALTRLDGPGARRLLRDRALMDDDPALRMQALNALASSSGDRALNILGQVLRGDPERQVRLTAIRALGRVGGNWARRSLERAARDYDPEVSLAAEKALANWP